MKLKQLLHHIFKKRKNIPTLSPSVSYQSYHINPSRLCIPTRMDGRTYERYFKYKPSMERQKILIQSAAKEFMGKILEMGLVKVVEYESEGLDRDHLAVFYIDIIPPKE